MKLITFEGLPGSNKTAVIDQVAVKLQREGYSVGTWKEPRFKRNHPDDTTLDTLSYLTARRQHVLDMLQNYREGEIVLWNRFIDSTMAIQGYGDGVDIELINQLNQLATAELEIARTIWLSLPASKALENLTERTGEAPSLARLQRIELGYQVLWMNDSPWHEGTATRRIYQVDLTQDPQTVLDQTLNLIREVI